jgi:hypothetical protein
MQVMEKARDIQVDRVYGKSLYIRGYNMRYLRGWYRELDMDSKLKDFNKKAGALFERLLREHVLNGE